MHDADVPRVAIYSSWTGTQEIGWVRFTFDKFGIPFDLIYKERVEEGQPARRLRRHRHADADTPTAQAVFQAAGGAAGAVHEGRRSTSSSAMYGESPDITGGMGGEGVDAFAKFLDAGGTLIAMGNAVRFPTELGLGAHGRRVGRRRRAISTRRGRSSTPRSCASITRCSTATPSKIMPIKYLGGPLMIGRRRRISGACSRATSAATRPC